MPEAIIFDLDGTLYRQDRLRRSMLVRLLRAHAVRPWHGYRTARALAAYRRAQEHLRANGSAADDLAGAQVDLASQIGHTDPAFVAAAVRRWMEDDPLVVLKGCRQPGLVEFLEACRQGGLRLGLFSDYPASAKLRALGVEDVFEVVLTAQSADVNTFKPDPRGLLLVAQRLGVAPAECLYIGDRPEVDAAAARAAGMHAYILSARTPKADLAAEWYTTFSSYAELRGMLGVAEVRRVAAAQPTLDRH